MKEHLLRSTPNTGYIWRYQKRDTAANTMITRLRITVSLESVYGMPATCQVVDQEPYLHPYLQTHNIPRR